MSFKQEDVEKVAKLSRIAIGDAEKESMASELSAIFDWIEQLSEVDDSDVEAVSSVSGESLPLREDVVTSENQVEEVLRNAPEREYDCYVVPKVIDAG